MARIIATGGLLVALAYAVTVVVWPRFRPDQIGPYVLLALIGAVIVGWRQFRRPHPAIWALALAAVALVPAVVVARGFGRVDMISVLFHAEFGLEGATLAGLETEILQGVLSATVIVLTCALLAGLWRLGTVPIVAAMAALLVINPAIRSLAMSQLQAAVQSDLMSRMTAPRLTDPAASPTDVVLIYLEGTDRQFADPDVWGDLYAPLQTLADEGTSFTRVGQIAGTGWSLAGMVATQCGVPVLPRGLQYRNNFDEVEAFMPNVACLGDVLADRGYAHSYVVGGDTGFGGIDTFYRTHQITRQIGLNEQISMYPAAAIAAAKASWVLDDQMVYQTARSEFEALAGGAPPFLLVVETIGPHGRQGILSRRCNDGGTVTLSGDVRAVVSCLLDDTLAFVRDAQALHARLRPGRDLRFAIMSDHLSHNPNLPAVDAAHAGFNTVIFVGGKGSGGRVIDKPGAMIDVFPTLLEWLGLSAPPATAGLGVSLFADLPTVTEVHGIALFDRMLVSDVPLSRFVWSE